MQVESFYDFISPKIKRFINLVCDNVEEQHEEYIYTPLNLTISLEYDEEICFSIVNTGMYQSFEDFGNVFQYLLFDLIFNAQMIGNNGKIKTEKGLFSLREFEQIKYIIDSSIIRKIIIDKDDE